MEILWKVNILPVIDVFLNSLKLVKPSLQVVSEVMCEILIQISNPQRTLHADVSLTA